MSIRSKLTQRLIQQLVNEGNNPTDLSRLLGVSRPTIYAWMCGQPAQNINLERLAKLAGHKLPEPATAQDIIDLLSGKRTAPDEKI